MKPERRNFRLLRRCDSGVAAVETALVLPVLAGLLIAVIEFSFVFYTYNTMQSAARDVARQTSINQLASSKVSSEIKQRLPKWAASHATSTMTESAPGNPSDNQITITVALPSMHASPLVMYSSYKA